MKEATINLWHEIMKKYNTLARWQNNLIILCIVSICTFWFLDLINIQEWFHLSEWMDHIKSEHM